jgi:hypothetical protein
VLIRFWGLRPGTSAGNSANVDAITIDGSCHVYLDPSGLAAHFRLALRPIFNFCQRSKRILVPPKTMNTIAETMKYLAMDKERGDALGKAGRNL